MGAIHVALDSFVHDERALFHAHGDQVCASGCAASRHPTRKLTVAAFEQLMREYALQPMTSASPALETLLFFGPQTREMIEARGYLTLDRARAEFLWTELTRTYARISIRLVDEHGQVRSHLPPTRVPFDRRHVFDMETRNLQPLVTSGTVKRVGLYHIWARL